MIIKINHTTQTGAADSSRGPDREREKVNVLMESDDLDYRSSPALISTNTDRPRSTVVTISLEYNLDLSFNQINAAL